MNKIEFIVKKPYLSPHFTGDCLLYPTYMKKDGKMYFLFNHSEPCNSWTENEEKDNKKLLKENGGKFIKFSGGTFKSPIEILEFCKRTGYTFNESKDKIFKKEKARESEDFYDFSGNFNECSQSFFFRVYDTDLINTITKMLEEM